MYVLMPVPDYFNYSGLVVYFDISIMIPPTLFFFIKIAKAIWGLSGFQKFFGIFVLDLRSMPFVFQ